jgi:hypothetical protein
LLLDSRFWQVVFIGDVADFDVFGCDVFGLDIRGAVFRVAAAVLTVSRAAAVVLASSLVLDSIIVAVPR